MDSSEFSPQHSCPPLVLSPGTWDLEGAVGQGHYKCGQWRQVHGSMASLVEQAKASLSHNLLNCEMGLCTPTAKGN